MEHPLKLKETFAIIDKESEFITFSNYLLVCLFCIVLFIKLMLSLRLNFSFYFKGLTVELETIRVLV